METVVTVRVGDHDVERLESIRRHMADLGLESANRSDAVRLAIHWAANAIAAGKKVGAAPRDAA